MADVSYPANSGFYNSVNQDRLYGAEDMNKPYYRIVSNGVFVTPQGTPWNDLRVVYKSVMDVTVKAGAGIFGYKWFELPSDLTITIGGNGATEGRLDSIIVHVDTNTSVRAASIVYRMGEAASTPVPPALINGDGIYEYRLANILVGAGVGSYPSYISGANITDTRTTAECGTVAGLIDQVDTSVLFTQWQTAYEEYFDQLTGAFNAYASIQQQAWEDFFEQAQGDLTATNNIVRLQGVTNCGQIEQVGSQYYLSAPVTVWVPSFDPDTDILNVYINGMMLDINMFSYVSSGDREGSILFNFTPPAYSNKLVLEVIKSVVPSDLSSYESTLQELNSLISESLYDTGWTNLELINNAEAFDSDNVPQIRRIGKQVYIRGAIKKPTIDTPFTQVPYVPSQNYTYPCMSYYNLGINTYCVIQIDTNGYMKIRSAVERDVRPLDDSAAFPISTCYSLD